MRSLGTAAHLTCYLDSLLAFTRPPFKLRGSDASVLVPPLFRLLRGRAMVPALQRVVRRLRDAPMSRAQVPVAGKFHDPLLYTSSCSFR